MARDTKLGPEDITRDIPNVGEEALRNLDEAGIVYIGAEVEPGDILCRQDHAEGRKPDDAGGEAPPRHLRREGVGRARHLAAPAAGRFRHGGRSARVQPPRHRHRRPYPRHPDRGEGAAQEGRRRRARASSTAPPSRASRKCCSSRSRPRRPKGIKKGSTLDDATLEGVERHEWWKIAVKDDKRQADIEALKAQYDEAANVINRRFEDRVEKLERGDELPPGVLKMVKVFVAVKRKLQPGDKMAGRHGNKGVISRILPQRGHAVPRGRDSGRHRAQPAGRAEPHERRADLRDPPRLGRARPRPADPGDARGHPRARQGRRRQGRQGDPRQAQGHLRRRLRQGHRRPRRRCGDGAGLQPHRAAFRWAPRCSTARASRTSRAMLEKAGLDTSGQVDPVRRPHRRCRSTAR